MAKEETIVVPRWFLEVVEDTLRIQNNINLELEKGTGETCQDRNVKQSLNGIRKLLKGEELTGMERLEKLQPSLTSNLDEAAEETAKKYYCSCLEKHNETGICDGCENVKLAFKAAIKWMTGQGTKAQLDKEDLIRLICGCCPPSYEVMEVFEKQGIGSYTGGFADRWDWNRRALEKKSKEQLWDYYQQIKNS